MLLLRNRRYLPIDPAITPSGRSTRIVPIQNDTVSVRMLAGDSWVFPLVRYPFNPGHRTLLQGQIRQSARR
jgi:hypothetical protein